MILFWPLILAYLCVTNADATPVCMKREFSQEKVSTKVPWKHRARKKALTHVDEFLHWSIPSKIRTFALAQEEALHHFEEAPQELQIFAEMHGYFSLFTPLVGKVSSSLQHIEAVRSVLQKIKTVSPLQEIAYGELMTKVLAYRDLQLGDQFVLSLGKEYQVAKIFHLWGGMPAFGLTPKNGGAPILLFRGTDISLDSQRGWASLMSDVDLAGPGFSVFKKSQKEIHKWLVAMEKIYGKTRVFGFSLGGTLAAYTFIFENEWMSQEPSYAFSAPGVSQQVVAEWARLDEQVQNNFVSYVNRGDIISKVGRLFGTVHELSAQGIMRPVTAHTALMSSFSHLMMIPVDVALENQSRLHL